MNIKWRFAVVHDVIFPYDDHVEFGLRDDGVVVWRKLKYNDKTGRYEPTEKAPSSDDGSTPNQ